MSKKSDSGVVLGFLLGFTSFFLYETFSDEKKKIKFLKDLDRLKKEYSPFILAFKKKLLTSKELDKSLKDLDHALGTNLRSRVINYNTDSGIEVKQKNTTRSIKKFFGAE